MKLLQHGCGLLPEPSAIPLHRAVDKPREQLTLCIVLAQPGVESGVFEPVQGVGLVIRSPGVLWCCVDVAKRYNKDAAQHGLIIAINAGFAVADEDGEVRGRESFVLLGSELEIRVFEVSSKQYAMLVEKAIHTTLTKAGFHVNGELFKADCLDLFCRRASLLCRKYVTLQEWRKNRLQKQRAMDKIEARRVTAEKLRVEAIEVAAHQSTALNIFISNCCTLDTKAACNASQFLQALNVNAGIHMKQKDLKELMTQKGLKFSTKGRNYRGITLNPNETQYNTP